MPESKDLPTVGSFLLLHGVLTKKIRAREVGTSGTLNYPDSSLTPAGAMLFTFTVFAGMPATT